MLANGIHTGGAVRETARAKEVTPRGVAESEAALCGIDGGDLAARLCAVQANC